LITKLLAIRLGKLAPQLINEKQTGLVPGRNIMENISLAYLMRDWAEEIRTPTFFLKSDLEKAFDRTDFQYLWMVRTKLGLGGKFLKLVHGLMVGAYAKVHINGPYTDE
jgi:hypothetical protein